MTTAVGCSSIGAVDAIDAGATCGSAATAPKSDGTTGGIGSRENRGTEAGPGSDRIRGRATRHISVTLLVLLWGVSATTAAGQSGPVKIVFLDVGQGDAVLVQAPEGPVALIDAGRGWLLGQLALHRVDSIAVAIASHPHADHIGGFVDILHHVPVGVFIDNGQPHTTAIYRQVMTAVERSRAHYRVAAAESITLGSVVLEILPPPPVPTSVNNGSVGVRVRYGRFSVLLTGDSDVDELNHFLRGGVSPVTVLKAAHHGARDGVSPAWLNATRPTAVVISVGAENGFGHPHPWALQYYKTVANEIYRTDLHGEITVLGSRDGSYEVQTVRGERFARAVETDPDPGAIDPRGPTTHIEVWVYPDAFGYDQFNLNGEYAVIRNRTAEPIPIAGWRLCNVERRCFTFPERAVVAAQDSVRVHTGVGRDDNGRFYMRETRALWHNAGDRALLYDADGRVVARYAY